MRSFNEEEYIRLLEKLVSEQYDEEDYPAVVPQWSGQEILDRKVQRVLANSVIDLTSANKTKIEDSLYQYRNIKVGKFSVKIIKYSTKPDNEDILLSLSIYEDKKNQLIVRVNILKDHRFTGRSWQKYFNSSNGSEIDIKTTVDIIKWLQAVQKLSAFV